MVQTVRFITEDVEKFEVEVISPDECDCGLCKPDAFNLGEPLTFDTADLVEVKNPNQ